MTRSAARTFMSLSPILAVLVLASCANSAHRNERSAKDATEVGATPSTGETAASADLTTSAASTTVATPPAARRVYTPIVHGQYLQHETQRFRYDPGFEPNPITFDRRNRPYMLTLDGKVQKLQDNGTWKTINLVPQIAASLTSQKITWVDKTFIASRLSQNMIVFDSVGDAYILFNTSRSVMTRNGKSVSCGLLLHSRDSAETWTAYPILSTDPALTWTSGKGARMEFQDGHNVISGPPPILLYATGEYLINTHTNRLKAGGGEPLPEHTTVNLILPKKVQGADGKWRIDLATHAEVTRTGVFGELHSGVGNTLLSVDNLVHVVYIALNESPRVVNGTVVPGDPCPRGTPSYIATYDRSAGTLGERKFLGCAGQYDSSALPIPDVHNHPAITVDSQKYLHVILGAHQDNFKYMKSTNRNDPRTWSTPVSIGAPKRDRLHSYTINPQLATGSYTYVGLVCDKSDKLHVVARWAGEGYLFRLVYMSKSARTAPTAAWAQFSDSYSRTFYPTLNSTVFTPQTQYAHQHLVVPSYYGYVVYHHRLTMDRYGRLFLAYETHEKQLTPEMVQSYCQNWPTECHAVNGVLTLDPDPGQQNCNVALQSCWYRAATRPHDPVLLRSNSGGASWHITTTADLAGAILR